MGTVPRTTRVGRELAGGRWPAACGVPCGWRSPRWVPPRPAEWGQGTVWASEADEERARQLFQRHLELDVIADHPLRVDAAATRAELGRRGDRAAADLADTARSGDLEPTRPAAATSTATKLRPGANLGPKFSGLDRAGVTAAERCDISIPARPAARRRVFMDGSGSRSSGTAATIGGEVVPTAPSSRSAASSAPRRLPRSASRARRLPPRPTSPTSTRARTAPAADLGAATSSASSVRDADRENGHFNHLNSRRHQRVSPRIRRQTPRIHSSSVTPRRRRKRATDYSDMMADLEHGALARYARLNPSRAAARRPVTPAMALGRLAHRGACRRDLSNLGLMESIAPRGSYEPLCDRARGGWRWVVQVFVTLPCPTGTKRWTASVAQLRGSRSISEPARARAPPDQRSRGCGRAPGRRAAGPPCRRAAVPPGRRGHQRPTSAPRRVPARVSSLIRCRSLGRSPVRSDAE